MQTAQARVCPTGFRSRRHWVVDEEFRLSFWFGPELQTHFQVLQRWEYADYSVDRRVQV